MFSTTLQACPTCHIFPAVFQTPCCSCPFPLPISCWLSALSPDLLFVSPVLSMHLLSLAEKNYCLIFSFFHFFMIYYRLDKMKCWFGVTTGNMYVISFSYEFARGLFTTCILAANVLIFWIGIINLHIWLTEADFWTMEMCKWRTLLFWLKTRLNIGSIKKPERTING